MNSPLVGSNCRLCDYFVIEDCADISRSRCWLHDPCGGCRPFLRWLEYFSKTDLSVPSYPTLSWEFSTCHLPEADCSIFSPTSSTSWWWSSPRFGHEASLPCQGWTRPAQAANRFFLESLQRPICWHRWSLPGWLWSTTTTSWSGPVGTWKFSAGSWTKVLATDEREW